ncbi:poly(A) RNA polymerase GLD2 [Pelomyxa schiedti]|nr:poly(A) RNA polymerase GLD2 [Pelomyxa schiedti]
MATTASATPAMTTATPAVGGKKRAQNKKPARAPALPSEATLKAHHPILRVRLTPEVDAKTIEPLLRSSGAKEVSVVESVAFALFETTDLVKAALESLRAREVGGKKLRVDIAPVATTYKLNGWALTCSCGIQFNLTQKGDESSAHKHQETCPLLHPVVHASEGALALFEQQFIEFFKQISLKEPDYRAREEFVTQLQIIFAQAAANNFVPPCSLYTYGSVNERTAVPGEHFELSVIHQSNVPEKQALQAFFQVLSLYLANNLSFTQTHVPAITQMRPTDAFPFPFNLVINHDICIFSTQLTRDYIQMDRRIQPIVVALKAWAQSIGWFNPKKSWMSSFCIDLLVIYFFQTRNPALLPNLQKDIERTSADQCRGGFAVEGENCFWRSSQFLPKRPLDATGKGQLLLQLFHFYGKEFNFGKNMVSIRLGTPNVPRTDTGKKGPVFIEDPFRHHNVADGIGKGVNFQAKCLEAHNKLAATGDLRLLLYGNVVPKPAAQPTPSEAVTPTPAPTTTTTKS